MILCSISIPENRNNRYIVDIKQDFVDSFNGNLPLSADDPTKSLNYSSIYQNATVVRRVFESIKFEVNISDFWDDGGNYTEIQFSFTNNTVVNLPMINDTGTGKTGNFTYIFTPRNNAPLGFQNVSFLIFNGSETNRELLLNSQTTKINFTIISNVMVGLNSSQYVRGDFLYAELMVKEDISNWNIAIVDGRDGAEIMEKEIGDELYQFTVKIDEWFFHVDAYYYVRVNITYNTKVASIYFRFFILNSPPKIIANSVKFSPSSVFRTSTGRIEVNVTDYENDLTPAYINVTMNLEDPEGAIESYLLDNDLDGSFKKNFVVAASKPAGGYKVNLTAKDQHGAINSYYTYLTVKNNPPIIHSYTINDNPMNVSISVRYGEDLVFGFNVSDIEGLAYITVALLNEKNEWFNLTREYIGANMTITIRTIDLVKGNWYVYVFVTDTDGYTVGLDYDYDTAPQEIRIIPDVLSVVLPWIAFFIGISAGILVGFGLGYLLLKKRALLSKESVSSKPPASKKRIREFKKVQSPRTTPIKREPIKRDTEEPSTEIKETDATPPPQRKIKRKLK